MFNISSKQDADDGEIYELGWLKRSNSSISTGEIGVWMISIHQQ